ncbi:hypothetical protein [Stappia sp. ICDLI1TA098]
MKTWFDYFDTDPYEVEGRYIEDAIGAKRILKMWRIAWAYVDWLAEVEGCDTAQFFKDNDINYRPEDGCYHDMLFGALYTAFVRREKKGLPRPDWMPPATWAEYQAVEDLDD